MRERAAADSGRWGRGKRVTGSSDGAKAAMLDLQRELYGTEAAAGLVPRAPAPPRLTPEQWRSSCLQASRQCGTCELCRWETEANRWHDWSPWREGAAMRLSPGTVRPGFASVDAAILAWWNWEMHGRTAPSGTGPLLDLIEQGAQFSGARAPKRDTALLRRADDVVHVDQALAAAFERVEVGANVCRAMLIARTPDVLDPRPTVEQIALAAMVAPALVRATIKAGRRALQVELSARGLVPMPARTSGLWWDIDVRRRELEGRSR